VRISYSERFFRDLSEVRGSDRQGYLDALRAMKELERRTSDPVQVMELPGYGSRRICRFVHRDRTRVVVIEFEHVNDETIDLLQLMLLRP
jgi:hypothetical protein